MDIARIRHCTRAVAHGASLHNAGSALMTQAVVTAMQDHIDREARIGGYAAADRETLRLDGLINRLQNC
jgi:cysteine desulfurase/selenocysteine lyase